MQGNDVEAVIKVLAKLFLFDHLGQVLVGCGDHPHVDLHRIESADRAHRKILQYAQHLGLQGQGHVADLVQKQGAPIGRLEQAGMT